MERPKPRPQPEQHKDDETTTTLASRRRLVDLPTAMSNAMLHPFSLFSLSPTHQQRQHRRSRSTKYQGLSPFALLLTTVMALVVTQTRALGKIETNHEHLSSVLAQPETEKEMRDKRRKRKTERVRANTETDGNSETMTTDNADPSTTTTKTIPLAILTAVSEGSHALEAVAMLQTLIYHNYQGPLYFYLMCREGLDDIESLENTKNDASDHSTIHQNQLQQQQESCQQWRNQMRQEISPAPLNIIFVDFAVMDPIQTYCFKPKAVAHFFEHYYSAKTSPQPQTLLWVDASVRFKQNPTKGAQKMIRDKIDFVGRQFSWTLPMQTHRQTFGYFDANPLDYMDAATSGSAIIATYFLVNLEKGKQQQQQANGGSTIRYSASKRTKVGPVGNTTLDATGTTLPTTFNSPFESILVPWMDCAILACRTCMAPFGSRKHEPIENQIARQPQKAMAKTQKDAATTTTATMIPYRGHRQDQAVLALLLRHYEHHRYPTQKRRRARIRLTPTAAQPYLRVKVFRNARSPYSDSAVEVLSDWNKTKIK